MIPVTRKPNKNALPRYRLAYDRGSHRAFDGELKELKKAREKAEKLEQQAHEDEEKKYCEAVRVWRR